MRRAHYFVVIVAVASLGSNQALARKKAEPAHSSGLQAPAAVDHDFGCTLSPAALSPWEAKGIRVPVAAKKQFLLWKSVSRVADLSESPAAEFGGWWSLTPPSADKAGYRKDTAVCSTWNDFSMVVECKLKKGTVVAIGTSQSAECSEKPPGCAKLPKEWAPRFASSPEHQMFINTFHRSQAEVDAFLLGCRAKPY